MDKLSEIWDAVTKRLSNPLLGSFAITWSLYNYKFLIVLFSSEDYQKKFSYIENVLYAPTTNPYNYLLFYPLIIASLFVFVAPVISVATTFVGTWWEVQQNSWKNKALSNSLISKEQAAEIRRISIETIRQKDTEIETLNQALNEASTKANGQFNTFFDAQKQMTLKALRYEYESIHLTQCIKMPEIRLHENDDMYLFGLEIGLPKRWIAALKNIQANEIIDVPSGMLRFELSHEEISEMLLGLKALGLISLSWVNNRMTFKLTSHVWAQKETLDKL